MNTSMHTTEDLNCKNHVCSNRCVSWSAVFTGALVAIAFSFLLNLLCLAIGISAFPTTQDGQLAFAVGGFVALTVCSILAMFPAGFVAGKIANSTCVKRRRGELHGLAAWTIALIVSVLLGASMGKFVNQTSYIVTRQPVDIRMANLNDNVMVATTQSADRNAAPVKVVIDPDKAAEATAMALFATFFIFFIGLLAACFGGRCATHCNRKEMENCGTNPNNTTNTNNNTYRS